MYYKITNTTCELYKKLHQLRTDERRMDKENREKVDEVVGTDWSDFYGHFGQRNWGRVTEYRGFVFNDPSKLDPKTWKRDEKNPSTYIPNLRCKEGKKMNKFLSEGLQRSSFFKLQDILNIEYIGRFSLPFVEIVDDVIILKLDENFKPSDPNLIEITSVEFKSIYESLKELQS